MVMVDRAFARLGLGRSLLDWAEEQITGAGHRHARLDCVRTNEALRKYYEEAGYLLVGTREFAGAFQLWRSTRRRSHRKRPVQAIDARSSGSSGVTFAVVSLERGRECSFQP